MVNKIALLRNVIIRSVQVVKEARNDVQELIKHKKNVFWGNLGKKCSKVKAT